MYKKFLLLLMFLCFKNFIFCCESQVDEAFNLDETVPSVGIFPGSYADHEKYEKKQESDNVIDFSYNKIKTNKSSCIFCGYGNKDHLRRHLLMKHYYCLTCKTQYSSKIRAIQCKRRHNNQPDTIQCKFCKYKVAFEYKENLVRHYCTQHFYCMKCEIEYTSSEKVLDCKKTH